MRHRIAILGLVVSLASPAAGAAACYADYKAKQDDPLRLHYGVAEITGPCTPANATAQLDARLASGGWMLLNVLAVFGPEGLAERKANAGPNYLRF